MDVRLKPFPRECLYEARNLQKGLEPGSSVHPSVNLEGDWDNERYLEPIRSAVTKTKDLLERLEDPDAPFERAEFDEFELAWNGIMPCRLRERAMQRES